MTILATDVHYEKNYAFASGVVFDTVTQELPSKVITSTIPNPEEYISGAFYKRELPCLVSLLLEHKIDPEVILVDGFSVLDQDRTLGLGGRLFETLQSKGIFCPVIGVSKNPRYGISKLWEVYRGASSKPIYVNACGISDQEAKEFVENMAGEFRIPTMLKMADTLCREAAKDFLKQQTTE